MLNKKVTAVVVDDERLARNEMRSLLCEHSQIQVVGEAADVSSAVTVIESTKPDVLFLDIKLGRESGMQLLDRISPTHRIVFVTAYDEYAVQAFEVNALDYLLKPVNPVRLQQTITRILLDAPASPVIRRLDYEDRLFVRFENHAQFLKVSEIRFIRAAGDYSELVLQNGKSGLILKSLIQWEKQLPENYFVRIHRAMIVNLEQVETIEEWFHQTYRIYLKGSADPLPVSRRYAARLKQTYK